MKRDPNRCRIILELAALAGLALAALACNFHGYVANIDSDGLARGVCLQGVYGYLADGFAGLKIYNVSSPQAVNLTGQLSLPGFATRVEVDQNWAALNDTQGNCCYLVDITDKTAPTLAWKVKTQNRVIEIKISNGILFLAEKGSGGEFTGVEVFGFGAGKPVLKQALSLEDLVDIAIDPTGFFVLESGGLAIYGRKGGKLGPLLGKLALSASDTMQSLDVRLSHFPIVLGQSLYLVDARVPAKPVLADQRNLAGNPSPRMVRISEPMTLVFTGYPWIHLFTPIVWSGGVFFYSTCKEAGQGVVDLTSGRIVFLKQTHDIDAESQGYARLYQVALPLPMRMVLSQGGICAVGALDNYGMVYAWLQ